MVKNNGPPTPQTEFEAWTIQSIVVMANDMAWVKRGMWILATLIAAVIGVRVL